MYKSRRHEFSYNNISKPFQISKMMRHIENPGIVKSVFRNIHQYSVMFRDIQGR